MDTNELKKYDFILAIDKSGSMNTGDCPGGKSRWAYAQEQTLALAQECEKFDSDGICVIPFNNNYKVYDNTTSAKVEQVFKENSPGGSTDTAKLLEHVLSDYRTRYDADNTVKPIILIVITDGAPDDEKSVDAAIINHTKWMKEDGQTGITFLQFGKDEGARQFLKHLDDDLQANGAQFDIVDTKNVDEMGDLSLTDLLLQAITD